MSADKSRWTPAQRRGVTVTSDRTESADTPRGAWSQDLETAVYGEQDWIVPGTGESGDDCGRWWPDSFCDEHAHIELSRHQCGRRSCGHDGCHGQWIREKAVAICTRLGAARDVAPEDEKRAIHGIASPPEGSVQTIEEFYDMIEDGYDLAKEKGVRGGAVVPHGYRVKDDIQDLIEEKREQGEFEGGDWKWVLDESDRHWRDLVYWSPHVHIIGWVGSNDVGQSDPENDEGWIWKNQRSLEEFYLTREGGYGDMIGLASYLMSHVTVQKGEQRQAYRWFGELAPASFSPEKELSEDRLLALERRAEEVAGTTTEVEEGEGGDDREECPREGCGGEQISIWEADAFLEQNGDELTEREYDRLVTAKMWRRGEIEPPPGLKRPKSQAQAEETLGALVNPGSGGSVF